MILAPSQNCPTGLTPNLLPPDGALLARLLEALEALRPFAEEAQHHSLTDDTSPILVSRSLRQAETLTLGHIRRAAEILQRNEKAPAAAPPGPTEM